MSIKENVTSMWGRGRDPADIDADADDLLSEGDEGEDDTEDEEEEDLEDDLEDLGDEELAAELEAVRAQRRALKRAKIEQQRRLIEAERATLTKRAEALEVTKSGTTKTMQALAKLRVAAISVGVGLIVGSAVTAGAIVWWSRRRDIK